MQLPGDSLQRYESRGGPAMKRVIVSVSTGRYSVGALRLAAEFSRGTMHEGDVMEWSMNKLPEGSPAHERKPYAFKAFALAQALQKHGPDCLLLWCDACILPIRDMTPLWERIERDGYWMSRNGYSNYEWTADSAYPDLFNWSVGSNTLEQQRKVNRDIEHVVATSFGLNMAHPKGQAFLTEYLRLARDTQAFCGPWMNSNYSVDGGPTGIVNPPRLAPCGPPDVRGHRHDQTAASVIAWRLGFELTSAPNIFAYKGRESENTILIADGAY